MSMRYYAPFPGGGDRYRPPDFPALRIGDAERDAVAADLGEHFAAGRLTIEELHERLAATFAAKTHGQLTQLVADLPGPRRLGQQPAVHYQSDRPARPREQPTSSDRAGRVAALSLLLLAMMIWLFTALLFARHGMPMGGPMGPGH